MKSRAGIQIELYRETWKSVFVHAPALFISQDDTMDGFIAFLVVVGNLWF